MIRFIDTTISIWLDTRRAKENGLYPVKLRVYSNALKNVKLYSIGKMDMTEKEFSSVWQTEKPRKEHQSKRVFLSKILSDANEVAVGINPFSFEQFEKKYFEKYTNMEFGKLKLLCVSGTRAQAKKVSYIMIDDSTGLVKIGRSVDPKNREITLQSEKPTIRMIHLFKHDNERELHIKYNSQRIRGEWFRLSQDEVNNIISAYA